jgi:hypothetical protein
VDEGFGKIRASEVRKQKTEERDAALLLLAGRFPRIWVPTFASESACADARGATAGRVR